VRWQAGHWLEVSTARFADNKAIGLRIARSVAERCLTLDVPITCSQCASLKQFSVTGRPTDPFTLLFGTSLEVNVDSHPDGKPTTRPLGYGLYGHFTALAQSKHPLSTAQLIAIAKTARMAARPDYSYLGKRP
jgi:hypothetical protein